MLVAFSVVLALAALARLGPADPVSPQERCVVAQRDSAELADIRANLRRNPVAAMTKLGLGIDEFETLSQVLHAKWMAELPTTNTAPAQLVAGAGVGWWCYRTAGDAWGDCETTQAECNRWRGRHVTDHFRAPCGGVPEQECIDITAGVQGVTVCEWQPRASCFAKHFKLAGNDDLACAPTIKICKARRTDVLKNYADDQSVKSDCAARE